MTRREIGTVLAALRYYQSAGHKPLQDIATDAGEIEALDDEEIDDLCERINLDALKGGE